MEYLYLYSYKYSENHSVNPYESPQSNELKLWIILFPGGHWWISFVSKIPSQDSISERCHFAEGIRYWLCSFRIQLFRKFETTTGKEIRNYAFPQQKKKRSLTVEVWKI